MGEQKDNENNKQNASLVFQCNYEGPSLIFLEFANLFEERGYGTLIGVSSVAGERGRASNYIYGSAKAAYTVFLSGLRNRLAKKNVHVITILPGFVDTKMTAEMNLPKKLLAKPVEVARAIFLAHNKKKDIVYVKPIWRYIMIVVKIIPEKIFKYLNI
jgi:short-subunit dehydrogenase